MSDLPRAVRGKTACRSTSRQQCGSDQKRLDSTTDRGDSYIGNRGRVRAGCHRHTASSQKGKYARDALKEARKYHTVGSVLEARLGYHLVGRQAGTSGKDV